jgi:hypothetical protein
VALPTPAPDSSCVVTGASSGIGAELARRLAVRGHGVTLVARREDRLRELASELERTHRVRAEVVVADVSDREGRETLTSELESRGLTVEVVVNNAGFGSAGKFQELDADRETEMVRLNCEAVVALSSHYLEAMVNRRRGAILNVASTAAFQPLTGQATYAATKAFVLSFTEALHSDLSGTGVTATALCPGPVETEFFEQAGIEGTEDMVPDMVKVAPHDVAEAGVAGLEQGRRVVIPGRINSVGATAGRLVPRSLLLPVLRRVYPLGK